MKREIDGITLIALVITIIVLLILAGISIATLTGENGLLGKAVKAKEEHVISQYKEEINLIITEEIAERAVKSKEELLIKSLDTKIRRKPWVNEIYKLDENREEQQTFETSTYLLVESKEHYEFLVEVDNENKIAKIVEVTKGTGEKYTVIYEPNGGIGERIEKQVKTGFSIRLEECTYSKDKFKFVGWCEDAQGNGKIYLPTSIYKAEDNAILYATWESTFVTITFDSNDGTERRETIEIAKGKEVKLPENTLEREGYEFVAWNTRADGSGTTYEEGDTINTTENVTLYAFWEKQREAPEYWKITKKTDVEWYNYGDAKISEPKLAGQMKPIKYIGENQTGNKWANAITMDGSMWVWIPRYAYKITSGYHSSTAGTIEVAFLDTQDNFLNGENGEITRNPKENGAGTTKWLVHPAFTSSAEDGGGFGELQGLWVGKFETTGTESAFSVLPGQYPVKTKNLNSMYRLAKNSKYGESVEINSHMAKNSEWGAIAYLAHSKYGTNGIKIESDQSYNGQVLIKTGGTEKVKDIYTTNKKQSTTFNAFGVYDLNSGSVEVTASYVNNMWEKLATYLGTKKGDLYGADEIERSTSTAYKMVYPATGTSYKVKDFVGDAIYETSDGSGNRKNSAWTSSGESCDETRYPVGGYPVFCRNGVFGWYCSSNLIGGGNGDTISEYYGSALRLVLAII